LEIKDLVVTPVFLFLVYVAAYIIRPHVTDEVTRRYFIPALTVRIVSAICLGLLYQFYYDGGDTFNFHTYGSRKVWEAFISDPDKGFRLFTRSADQSGLYRISSAIPFYYDDSSFFIVRIAAAIDLFTFSTYSATATVFAIINFVGMWLFFQTFYRLYPDLHKHIAVAAFFIPSVVFWGSGLLKDSITLASLGAATYTLYQLALIKKIRVQYLVVFVGSLLVLYNIKIYILLTFLPASVLWIFMDNFRRMGSLMLRLVLFPLVFSAALLVGFYAMIKAAEDNPKYSLGAIAKTAQVTAYDIRYWTGKSAGSGYSLGELDGSWQSMIRLAPQAINVSLFRPYLWEVKNPLMVLSAIESFALLLLTLFLIGKARLKFFVLLTNPTILFCVMFSLAFAFAVGVSTFNFGTLSRYKIPFLPFYVMAIVLINHYSNRERNTRVLDSTE
jgi:hypothetical protein